MVNKEIETNFRTIDFHWQFHLDIRNEHFDFHTLLSKSIEEFHYSFRKETNRRQQLSIDLHFLRLIQWILFDLVKYLTTIVDKYYLHNISRVLINSFEEHSAFLYSHFVLSLFYFLSNKLTNKFFSFQPIGNIQQNR